MPSTTEYHVSGMTCDHCVRAITTELVMLSGVRAVDVDLDTGTVTVTSESPLDEAQVRQAID